MHPHPTHRYEQLANTIVGMIEKDALLPGTRMPSARALSAQHGVSISMAMQAYGLLKDRGVLVARPQSGFFVAGARPGIPSHAPGSLSSPASTGHRYEQLADLLVNTIQSGALAPGMRVPSVRATSDQHRVSVSTVLQAYRLLEDRGVLVARPQSGYYVAEKLRGSLALPSASRMRPKASAVSIGGAVAALLEHSSNAALVPLGCAVPDAALLRSTRLDLALARAARKYSALYNTYGPPQGDERLRREIAKRAIRTEQALSPDDIVITSGCTEAIVLALTSVTTRGDTVAVESPTYFGLLHSLEVLGLKALELSTDPTRGINVGALAKALETQPVAACVLSSGISNPLGWVMPVADKLELLALLARHSIPLIEDDVYGELHFARERPKPFIALSGGANTIYCSSFSKSLAPGFRVGWIVPGAFLQRVVERKLAFSLCNPVLPQVALADVLASGGYDLHLRRMTRIMEDKLIQMRRVIEASFPAGTRVSRPVGGFVLWLELLKQFDSRALFDLAVDEGICFAPGDVFSASRRFRNCLRLTAGYSWNSSIENAVRRLGELAHTLLQE